LSEEVSARIALLDAQIVDSDRLPIGRVDDVLLSVVGEGAPRVVALLSGSEALGGRLGGWFGGAMAAASSRMRSAGAGPGPTRIDPTMVEELMPMLRLRAKLAELPDLAPLERLLSERFVGRLPGSGDAAQ